MRRFLIMLAVMFAGSAIMYAASPALLGYALTRGHPYPTVMAGYQMKDFRSYEQAKRAFSDFVASTLPIGSDAGAAIAQMTRGGFQVAANSEASVELVWERHAGPCNELYSIIVSRGVDGRIAKVVGSLRPTCL